MTPSCEGKGEACKGVDWEVCRKCGRIIFKKVLTEGPDGGTIEGYS